MCVCVSLDSRPHSNGRPNCGGSSTILVASRRRSSSRTPLQYKSSTPTVLLLHITVTIIVTMPALISCSFSAAVTGISEARGRPNHGERRPEAKPEVKLNLRASNPKDGFSAFRPRPRGRQSPPRVARPGPCLSHCMNRMQVHSRPTGGVIAVACTSSSSCVIAKSCSKPQDASQA